MKLPFLPHVMGDTFDFHVPNPPELTISAEIGIEIAGDSGKAPLSDWIPCHQFHVHKNVI